MSPHKTKQARADYQRRWRIVHPTESHRINRANYRKHRNERCAQATRLANRNRVYVNEKKTKPCTDCARSYPPYIMQFDHVRGVKRASVSRLVSRGASFTTLDAEIEKCDLVCANCHLERTAQRGWKGAGRPREIWPDAPGAVNEDD